MELPREAEDDVWSLTERERTSLGIAAAAQEPQRGDRDRREVRAPRRDAGRARLRLLPAQQARGVGRVPRPGLGVRARPDAPGPLSVVPLVYSLDRVRRLRAGARRGRSLPGYCLCLLALFVVAHDRRSTGRTARSSAVAGVVVLVGASGSRSGRCPSGDRRAKSRRRVTGVLTIVVGFFFAKMILGFAMIVLGLVILVLALLRDDPDLVDVSPPHPGGPARGGRPARPRRPLAARGRLPARRPPPVRRRALPEDLAATTVCWCSVARWAPTTTTSTRGSPRPRT